MAFFGDFVVTINEAELAAILADFYAASNDQRPNDFTPTNPSVVNTVNVAIAPPIPTAGDLQPTIEFAQAVVADSVAEFGVQETPLVVTLLETLDDAGDLAGYLTRPVPAFWFGNIQVVMNGLTDAQRTTITNLEIGSQISVTKTFPSPSSPASVTQLMALEGISHDITPDRHIVTLYTNPARIYTYFTVGGYTTTTTRTNVMGNPNFEVDTLTWGSIQTSGLSSVARITTDAYIGTACLQVTKGTGRTETLEETAIGTVVAGNSYTISGYMKVPIGNETMTAGCRALFFDASNTQLGSFVTGTTASLTSTSGWVRFSVTTTAPANSSYVRAYFGQTSGATAGQIFLLDAVLVEQSSSALPYFDGTYADTYTGYTLTSQSWSGTANASTSTATWGLTSSFVGSELNDDTKGLG
jgi:hypothetical protein